MRKNIVVGNWKMNKNREDANILVLDILSQLSEKDVEIVFAPSFVHLYKVAKLCASNNNVSVSLSIGISIYPDNAVNKIDLLEQADKAMYLVKNYNKIYYIYS